MEKQPSRERIVWQVQVRRSGECVDGVFSGDPVSRELETARKQEFLVTLRNSVVDFLNRHGADPDLQFDARLVVSELIANAIEHSQLTGLEVQIGTRTGAVEIRVVNPRQGNEALPTLANRAGAGKGNVLAERGRGREITDELGTLTYERDGQNTIAIARLGGAAIKGTSS